MDKTFEGKMCNKVGSRDPRQLEPLCFGCVDDLLGGVLLVATQHCIFFLVPFLLSFLTLWLDVCAPWVWTLGKES